MKLTWRDFFIIIKGLYEINQNKLSSYLHCAPSTISRIITGIKLRFKYTSEEIYTCLFDPINADNPVYKKNERDLLSNLIEYINKTDFKDIIKDLNEKDYKEFTIGLIKIVIMNQPPKNITQLKIKQTEQFAVSSNNLDIKNYDKTIELPNKTIPSDSISELTDYDKYNGSALELLLDKTPDVLKDIKKIKAIGMKKNKKDTNNFH